VIPWVREWYETYKDTDFEIVSVHYPEFEYEKDYDNVAAATERLNVTYPVAIDNDGRTWRAYRQRYWPTRYVLDKRGHIRYKHIGEGAYEETEAAIQALLAEPAPVELGAARARSDRKKPDRLLSKRSGCAGDDIDPGAPERTRTSTPKGHRPSTCCVCQFRHRGAGNIIAYSFYLSTRPT
jgi:hypothetical protein